MSTASATFTPQDLLTLPDAERFELVDGQLVEREMGWNASYVGGRVHFFLSEYCDRSGVACAAPADASYQCFPDAPQKVRRPDASAIRVERLPPAEEREGHCPVAPDVAAEVVSPNDFYSDVEIKVDEYLRAGAQLVWVVDPPTRSVRVHRADGSVEDLSENDDLAGEGVLPGFRCAVADLFREPVVKT